MPKVGQIILFSCSDIRPTLKGKMGYFPIDICPGLVDSLLERMRGAVSWNYWKPRILDFINLIACCLGICSFSFIDKHLLWTQKSDIITILRKYISFFNLELKNNKFIWKKTLYVYLSSGWLKEGNYSASIVERLEIRIVTWGVPENTVNCYRPWISVCVCIGWEYGWEMCWIHIWISNWMPLNSLLC